MAFEKLAQKAARKLYHAWVGCAIRNLSKHAVDHRGGISGTSNDHEDQFSMLERLAIKADLGFSNMAAGDDRLHESADDMKHLARMIRVMHGDDAKDAYGSYSNLLNISFLNTEYSQLCNNVVSQGRSGMYAGPDVVLGTLLSGSKRDLLPSAVNDSRTFDRAISIMDEHMGLSYDYVGTRGFDEYLSQQRSLFMEEVRKRVASHWLFDDCYRKLESWVGEEGKGLGKNDIQIRNQIAIKENKAINTIVDAYIARRRQEHKDAVHMNSTNYGLSHDNRFGIHLTGKDIEEGFNKGMVKETVISHAYSHDRSFIGELRGFAAALIDMPSVIADFVRYGPSYGSQVINRMNIR